MKSITDKAEVSVDFPDKTYMGAFGRESSFDVKVEADEVLLRLIRTGEERREIAVHLHYYLLADLLKEIGQGLASQEPLDESHLGALRDGHDVVILDRYVASNAAYSAARLNQGADGEVVSWVGELEYGRFGLTEPDHQILLDVPVAPVAPDSKKP